METTLHKAALATATSTPKTRAIGYWIVTGLFCLQMSFTAYAQLRLPQVAEAFAHLGFPGYFRIELSLGKAPRRGAVAGAGAVAAQGVGLRRFRHRRRLGHHRSRRGGRRRIGVGLGRGHRRALGPVVLFLAAPPGQVVTREMELPMKKPVAAKSASALIDERIKELGDWRGTTFARIRKLIHQADPEIVEEWKWMGTPIFSHGGIVCTGETYKSVVKLTFAKGASLKDPAKLFNSSLEGNTRRAIDIHEGEEIDEAALKDLIRTAVAHNLEGKSLNKPKPQKKRSKKAT